MGNAEEEKPISDYYLTWWSRARKSPFKSFIEVLQSKNTGVPAIIPNSWQSPSRGWICPQTEIQ